MKYICALCEKLVGQVYDTSKGAVCGRCYDDLERDEDDSA